MPGYYEARFQRGVRWNDPAFGIQWPDDECTMNERDAGYPDFNVDDVRDLT